MSHDNSLFNVLRILFPRGVAEISCLIYLQWEAYDWTEKREAELRVPNWELLLKSVFVVID